ncbi:MAG: Rab family GTPase [Candidatus Helarchaeota archaeon]
MESLIKGIVFSKFDEKKGPIPVAWHPATLPLELREVVSLKSINILAGEKGMVPKSLALIPFPLYNIKGIIKTIEIPDWKHRGGHVDSSITLLFDAADDLIFYKYLKYFEPVFEKAAKKIQQLPHKSEFNKILEHFQKEISEILKDLRLSELGSYENKPFPLAKEPALKEGLKVFRFKIIICGDPEVGKTSLVLRFTDRAFRRTYLPTLGVNISEKFIIYNQYAVQFIFWDIAGQTKFQIIRKHFYNGAHGLLLVFDLTRLNTFQNLRGWFKDIQTYVGSEIKGLLLGNKNDLIEQREISPTQISKLAYIFKLPVIETSALTGNNVEAAFYQLGQLLIQQKLEKK